MGSLSKSGVRQVDRVGTYAIHKQQFAADIRASVASKEDRRPGEVLRFSPPASRYALGYLAQALRVVQQLFIPGRIVSNVLTCTCKEAGDDRIRGREVKGI